MHRTKLPLFAIVGFVAVSFLALFLLYACLDSINASQPATNLCGCISGGLIGLVALGMTRSRTGLQGRAISEG